MHEKRSGITSSDFAFKAVQLCDPCELMKAKFARSTQLIEFALEVYRAGPQVTCVLCNTY